jgi:hypothetical protein
MNRVAQPQAVTLIFAAVAAPCAAGRAPEPDGACGSVTCWPSAFAAAVICVPRADRIRGSAPCAWSRVYLTSNWFNAACCCALDVLEEAADDWLATVAPAAFFAAAASGGGAAPVGTWPAAEAAVIVNAITRPFGVR